MSVRLVVICALALAASDAFAQPLPPGQQPSSQQQAMANPASVNCAKLGGRHTIRNLASGQVGMCVFKDGRVRGVGVVPRRPLRRRRHAEARIELTGSGPVAPRSAAGHAPRP